MVDLIVGGQLLTLNLACTSRPAGRKVRALARASVGCGRVLAVACASVERWRVQALTRASAHPLDDGHGLVVRAVVLAPRVGIETVRPPHS